MSAARDPDKIWDGNHTVDNLLADKSSFYLASLQYQTQTSTSRVTPIPEEEGRSTGHEDFPLVPGLERDNRAATWPQNKPE
ncbi:hypothetical protein I302_108690 [Kwoniella bestiolae CBS 10118]|uniref:Uncharacterized protein n=1 Tax=Kwoniella bestiolae CBS 10118 TaxID=1296100 RepID=A0A1B9FTU7_9TREE|nr:hypothetical protein I302_07826 [Kwoniella bestiolae CBS 10118]OCF22182.1 hypothetical protein I302_07826 [Kwoniella bestiolae CBS 10118]